MAKFKLKESTIDVRGTPVTVRELTQEQRNAFSLAVSADKNRGPAFVAAAGTVDPPLTEEEALQEPGGVVEALVDEILKLSGMKKDTPEKEPNAR